MNKSWSNPSTSSSPGFVYFNTSNSNQSQSSHSSFDTPEFLSFGSDNSPGGSPYGGQFTPTNYSSPRNHYNQKNFRHRGGKNQFYSPIKHTGGKSWRKNLGLTGPAVKNNHNSNNSYENSPNQSRHYQVQRRQKSFQRNISGQSSNCSVFYDPTCLEDPWAELEKKLAEERSKQQNNKEETQKSSQSTSPDTEIEAEEASSDESEEEEDDSDEMEQSFS